METYTTYGQKLAPLNYEAVDRNWDGNSNHSWDQDINDMDIQEDYQDAILDFLIETATEATNEVMLKLKANQLTFPGLPKNRFVTGFTDITIKFGTYNKMDGLKAIAGEAKFNINSVGEISDVVITIYPTGMQTMRQTYITLGHELRHLTYYNETELTTSSQQEADAEEYGEWLANEYGY